jgi:hypothetical protein
MSSKLVRHLLPRQKVGHLRGDVEQLTRSRVVQARANHQLDAIVDNVARCRKRVVLTVLHEGLPLLAKVFLPGAVRRPTRVGKRVVSDVVRLAQLLDAPQSRDLVGNRQQSPVGELPRRVLNTRHVHDLGEVRRRVTLEVQCPPARSKQLRRRRLHRRRIHHHRRGEQQQQRLHRGARHLVSSGTVKMRICSKIL